MKLSTLLVSLLMLLGACAADGPEATEAQDQGLIVVGQQCGARICPVNTHCCNASCGSCVPPGVECTQQACKAEEAAKMTAEEAADLVIIGDDGK